MSDKKLPEGAITAFWLNFGFAEDQAVGSVCVRQTCGYFTDYKIAAQNLAANMWADYLADLESENYCEQARQKRLNLTCSCFTPELPNAEGFADWLFEWPSKRLDGVGHEMYEGGWELVFELDTIKELLNAGLIYDVARAEYFFNEFIPELDSQKETE